MELSKLCRHTSRHAQYVYLSPSKNFLRLSIHHVKKLLVGFQKGKEEELHALVLGFYLYPEI